jgi:hypothetical protein
MESNTIWSVTRNAKAQSIKFTFLPIKTITFSDSLSFTTRSTVSAHHPVAQAVQA